MGRANVREGKGGASRTVLLNDYCRQILAIYIEEIRPLILTSWHDEKLLFGTVSRDCFAKVINRRIKKTAEVLNLPSIRAHGFRHALGYHLLRAGCLAKDIQTILGHKSIETTLVYTHQRIVNLKKIYRTYHPRENDFFKELDDEYRKRIERFKKKLYSRKRKRK
ncbi:MAG: tyrosine-type recombinase/integrase [Spirochaetaceae bacterium]|nr:tyrosine-type recombinase/integrase [Spirochaetaceae bacterium]